MDDVYDIVRIDLKFYKKTITFWKSAFRPSLKLIVIFCTNAKPAHLRKLVMKHD